MRLNVVIDKNRWRFDDVEVRKHTCTRTNNRVETRGLSLTWHDYYGAETHSIPSFFSSQSKQSNVQTQKDGIQRQQMEEKKKLYLFLASEANEQMSA